MTELTILQESTLNAVRPRGRKHEITGAQLQRVIGLKPRSEKAGAEMRSVIHALRVKGYPICVNGKGYFWPADRAELDAYLEDFEARIQDQQKALNGMRANLAYEYQEPVEL